MPWKELAAFRSRDQTCPRSRESRDHFFIHGAVQLPATLVSRAASRATYLSPERLFSVDRCAIQGDPAIQGDLLRSPAIPAIPPHVTYRFAEEPRHTNKQISERFSHQFASPAARLACRLLALHRWAGATVMVAAAVAAAEAAPSVAAAAAAAARRIRPQARTRRSARSESVSVNSAARRRRRSGRS